MKKLLILALVALLVIAALAAFIVAIITYQGRVGACIGLLLGVFFGPTRLLGVDFRQWFRDPGTPSELGDDSPIGLMRGGFQAAGWFTLLASLAFLFTVMTGRVTVPCTQIDPAAALSLLPGGFHLRSIGDYFVRFLQDCGLAATIAKLVIGALIGLAVAEVVAEIIWRLGLRVGVPDPAAPTEYLATRPLGVVRAKTDYPNRRRLIVCCDGTWNWPEPERETNVVRLVRSLLPDDNGIAQIVHYHQGVGTGNVVDRIAGGGAGVGLTASVKACYGFLVDNYKEHDEIFLFGFSRGAYVARALGGAVCAIGILHKRDMDRFANAWNWYWQDRSKRDRAVLDKIAPDRRADVDIECIGVWDTVGALGIPGSRWCANAFAFHDTEISPQVRHAFQALAIDEQRGNFQGAVWVPHEQERPTKEFGVTPKSVEAASQGGQGPLQILKQVWFPGYHSNIGGGYENHGLSDTTFLWMISELKAHKLLAFDDRCIVRALDTDRKEYYPKGVPENSRTLFWRVIGCPVPRPVGIISDTERVHQSAWERRDDSAVASGDIYKRAARRRWLKAMDVRKISRSDLEKAWADEDRPARPRMKIRKKLDPCARVLSFVGGRG